MSGGQKMANKNFKIIVENWRKFSQLNEKAPGPRSWNDLLPDALNTKRDIPMAYPDQGPPQEETPDQGPPQEQAPDQGPQQETPEEKIKAAGQKTLRLMRNVKPTPGLPKTSFSIKDVQNMLVSAGFGKLLGKYGADGAWGRNTYNAVIAFQKKAKISADGVFGPDSLKAMAKMKPRAVGDARQGAKDMGLGIAAKFSKETGLYTVSASAGDGTKYQNSDKNRKMATAVVKDLISAHEKKGKGYAKALEKKQNKAGQKGKSFLDSIMPDSDPKDMPSSMLESQKELKNIIRRVVNKLLDEKK